MGRAAVGVVIGLWTLPIAILLNRIVPHPYMDEIFHVPQAQQYCRFNFKSWDPMITTPLGLYFLSLAHIASLFPGLRWCGIVSDFSELCSTAILRSINCVLSIICGVLFYDILRYTRPTLSERNTNFLALVLALYPVHWFFSYLYYTDIASTALVMAMYLMCLKRSYWISALLGGLAITIRQTNVVWMFFVACGGAFDYTGFLKENRLRSTSDSFTSVKKYDESTYVKRVSRRNNLLRRRGNNSVDDVMDSSLIDVNSSQTRDSGLFDEVYTIFWRLWYLKFEIVVLFLPYLVVLILFVTFVVWNGSIVLGAKDAHAVSPHFVQLLYFGAVASVALGSTHFSLGQVHTLYQSFSRMKSSGFLLGLLGLIFAFVSVHFFSIAHPYLLADNRHYPFYLWRRIIQAHWLMKYLLVPLYVYSWFSIFNVLGKNQKKICIMLYIFACAAVLVPAPLIEFRYYTIPFYLLVLQSPLGDNKNWYFVGLLYILVNLFTMALFLFRPFKWHHEPGIQRFMW